MRKFQVKIDAVVEAEDADHLSARLAAHAIMALTGRPIGPGVSGQLEVREIAAPRVHEVSIADGIGMPDR